MAFLYEKIDALREQQRCSSVLHPGKPEPEFRAAPVSEAGV